MCPSVDSDSVHSQVFPQRSRTPKGDWPWGNWETGVVCWVVEPSLQWLGCQLGPQG